MRIIKNNAYPARGIVNNKPLPSDINKVLGRFDLALMDAWTSLKLLFSSSKNAPKIKSQSRAEKLKRYLDNKNPVASYRRVSIEQSNSKDLATLEKKYPNKKFYELFRLSFTKDEYNEISPHLISYNKGKKDVLSLDRFLKKDDVPGNVKKLILYKIDNLPNDLRTQFSLGGSKIKNFINWKKVAITIALSVAGYKAYEKFGKKFDIPLSIDSDNSRLEIGSSQSTQLGLIEDPKKGFESSAPLTVMSDKNNTSMVNPLKSIVQEKCYQKTPGDLFNTRSAENNDLQMNDRKTKLFTDEKLNTLNASSYTNIGFVQVPDQLQTPIVTPVFQNVSLSMDSSNVTVLETQKPNEIKSDNPIVNLASGVGEWLAQHY